jgi:hypothetical protein
VTAVVRQQQSGAQQDAGPLGDERLEGGFVPNRHRDLPTVIS